MFIFSDMMKKAKIEYSFIKEEWQDMQNLISISILYKMIIQA